MSGTDLETATGVAPRERSERPIGAGVDIGHVHLKTADIDRVHHFYVDILGFDVVFRRPDALFLSAGGYHHHLGFNTWESKGGNPPPPGATGLYHVAIRYPTRAALGDALRRLVAADWPLDGVNDHGTHEALYLRDPDENGLELCWDRPEDQWPKDAEGHLTFSGRRLDLDGLFREGAGDDAQGSTRRPLEDPEASGSAGSRPRGGDSGP